MVETSPSERRGDPSVAVLLTWFLPGAGHLYLGRTTFALAVFLALEGLYLLGWYLTGGRTFEYLDPELRGPLATLLTPEAGNLGAMLVHLKVAGFGTAEPVPYPTTMVLGSFLSAMSGMLNLFVAAHANLAARVPVTAARRGLHPALLVGAGWLLPGLGHWLQGRRLRGALVFALLLGLFAAGTWLAHGTNLSRERHFYYWSGQFLLGGPAILAEALAGHPPLTRELRFVDVGLLYACMAGLLNVLAMLDVFGVGEKRWLAPVASLPASPAAPASPGEVPA
jgi:hypothetical protein